MKLRKKTTIFLVILSLCFLSVQCGKILNRYNAQKHLKSANAWANKGEYDKALIEYNKAIDLDPEFAGAYYDRGLVWYKKGEQDKAVADFDKTIELDPKFALAYNNRGWLYFEKNEFNKAMLDYDKATELDPKLVWPYKNRGVVWNKKGEYDKAVVEFDKVIELDPKFTSAYYDRGNAWSKKGEYDKALADFNKAIEIDPQSGSVYNNKAWFLATCPNAKFRNGKQAVELAQKALELQKHYAILDTLAAAFAESGNFKEAVATQEKAIALLKEKGGDEQAMAGCIKRLENYKAGKPWRE